MTDSKKLSGAAIRHLRGLGHDLAPVVQVGKNGVTPEVIAALDAALTTHELVKVKLAAEEREESAAALADGTKAVLAQVLGRTALVYRRHPKEPKIQLPKK